MIDFDFLLHEQSAYPIFGVEAMLTLNDTAGTTVDLTVLDKTAGLAIDGAQGGRKRFTAEVETVEPAAMVRRIELTEKSVTLADLDGASIAFNSKTWFIRNHGFRPSPNGEGEGEVVLFLTEQ